MLQQLVYVVTIGLNRVTSQKKYKINTVITISFIFNSAENWVGGWRPDSCGSGPGSWKQSNAPSNSIKLMKHILFI
jgi:hypothetical protein